LDRTRFGFIIRQLEFGGGEVDDLAAPPNLVRVVIQFEVIDADDGVVVLERVGPAEYSPDAGHHLVEAEGLRHVVVSAHGESGDLVIGIIPGRQEDDREVPAGSPQPARDGEPVHVGQHDVEDREVGVVQFRGGEGIAAVRCGDDVEPGESQGRRKEFTDVRFVVDDEQLRFGTSFLHPSSIRRLSVSSLDLRCEAAVQSLGLLPPMEDASRMR
jgi:hypothetical protein